MMTKYHIVLIEDHGLKFCCQVYRQEWFLNGEKMKNISIRWTEKLHKASIFNSLDSVEKLKSSISISGQAVVITENEYNVFLTMTS